MVGWRTRILVWMRRMMRMNRRTMSNGALTEVSCKRSSTVMRVGSMLYGRLRPKGPRRRGRKRSRLNLVRTRSKRNLNLERARRRRGGLRLDSVRRRLRTSDLRQRLILRVIPVGCIVRFSICFNLGVPFQTGRRSLPGSSRAIQSPSILRC